MKAYLDGIFSIDLSSGKPELPEDPENCWIVIQADIGAYGGSGADTFTFYVCTINKLNHNLSIKNFKFGRHLILVKRFDWDIVEHAIKSMLDELEADTWEQLAAKIHEYGEWEFNDYDDTPIC